jgi:hypothetical protein
VGEERSVFAPGFSYTCAPAIFSLQHTSHLTARGCGCGIYLLSELVSHSTGA